MATDPRAAIVDNSAQAMYQQRQQQQQRQQRLMQQQQLHLQQQQQQLQQHQSMLHGNSSGSQEGGRGRVDLFNPDLGPNAAQFCRIWSRKLRYFELIEGKVSQKLSRKLPQTYHSRAKGRQSYQQRIQLIQTNDLEWIRCCSPTCAKWRAIHPHISGHAISARSKEWFCCMNFWDESQASCSAPQDALWNTEWNLFNIADIWARDGADEEEEEEEGEGGGTGQQQHPHHSSLSSSSPSERYAYHTPTLSSQQQHQQHQQQPGHGMGDNGQGYLPNNATTQEMLLRGNHHNLFLLQQQQLQLQQQLQQQQMMMGGR
jgi:hypothetical protein